MKINQCLSAALIAVPLALLQACAYQRPAEVTAQMARTESTLQQAQQSGAEVNSLPELQRARDKYADAQRALQKNNKEGDRMAMQLAQQAEVDARLAAAKAQSTRQEQAAGEVQEGVKALRDEATRDTGSSSSESAPANHPPQ